MTLKRPLMQGASLALLAASLASMASVAPLANHKLIFYIQWLALANWP